MTQAEDTQVASIKGICAIEGVPTRPGFGTVGDRFIVRVNMFELNPTATPVPLHKYNVDFGQNILTKNQKAQMISAIVKRAEFKAAGMQWATDYSNIIVTTQKLKQNIEGKAEPKDPLDTALPPPTTDAARDASARRTQRFKVTYENTFDLRDLFSYLRRTQHGQEYEGRADIVQLLNIIISKPCRDNVSVSTGGQNSFFPLQDHNCFSQVDLGGGLSAYRGFFSSVRYSVGRVLVNVNVANGAFFNALPLRNLIAAICGSNPTPSKRDILAKVEPVISRLKVLTRYMKPRDANGKVLTNKGPLQKVRTLQHFAKEYRRDGKGNIIDFRYRSCNDVKFQLASAPGVEGGSISVTEYFKKYHDITLQWPEEPPIDVGTSAHTNWLPQELCVQVLSGQPYRGLLQGNQTRNMIGFAATPPAIKAMAIQGTNSDGPGLETLKLRGGDQANSTHPFGLDITPRMITVPARRLPAPELQYGAPSGQQAKFVPASGSWNLRKADGKGHHRFFLPAKFECWQTLTIDLDGQPKSYGQRLVGLFKDFGKDLATYGIVLGPQGPDLSCSVPNPTFGREVDRQKTNQILEAQFARAAKDQRKILLVILKDQNAWLYSRVKFYGDIKYGIHTVCCINDKFTKEQGRPMLWANLALKFNIKGGGVNHKISMDKLKPFDNATILVGIDVTHPSPTSSDDAPSIAAVVASKNEHLTEWPASIRVQQRRQEIVSELKDMLLERFRLWEKCNGRLPNKVIVYRDGVSEGQYQAVLVNEKAAFDALFNGLYGSAEKHPDLTILIVGKRHHIRAYATTSRDADRKGNLLPGTIIDRGITHPTRHDFYLQSHAVLQGTGRAAHYDVIKDDVRFSADDLQTFTHNLSYMFNRATKSVSVVPPAYYADLACERGRQYLHTVLQESQATGSKRYNPQTSEWSKGVHPNLRESTFYI